VFLVDQRLVYSVLGGHDGTWPQLALKAGGLAGRAVSFGRERNAPDAGTRWRQGWLGDAR
jgi:hypothetical protein